MTFLLGVFLKIQEDFFEVYSTTESYWIERIYTLKHNIYYDGLCTSTKYSNRENYICQELHFCLDDLVDMITMRTKMPSITNLVATRFMCTKITSFTDLIAMRTKCAKMTPITDLVAMT